jgi:hypothetical protein
LIQEKEREKGEIFYIIKWVELNINGKFEGEIKYANLKMFLSGFSERAKGFGIALHGFILLLPECDYLFHTRNHHHFTSELWGNSAKEKMTRESFLMSNISWKLFYFLGPSQTASLSNVKRHYLNDNMQMACV